jgi:hypothetical protein
VTVPGVYLSVGANPVPPTPPPKGSHLKSPGMDVRLAETLSPWHVSPSWKPGLRSNCIRDRAIFPGRAIRR